MKPTLGRIVRYRGFDPLDGTLGVFAAIVTKVRSSLMVDLTVFMADTTVYVEKVSMVDGEATSALAPTGWYWPTREES